MIRPLALSSVVALVGLLDPTCVNPLEDDAPAQTKAEAASVEDCVAACAGGKTLSDTDRQTCRLLCEKDVDDPGPAARLTARFELCESRCEPQAKTDAATCALNCEQAALSSLEVSDADRTCLSGCLDTWQACETTCEGESKTDAETCRLQCDQAAKSCGDACVK